MRHDLYNVLEGERAGAHTRIGIGTGSAGGKVKIIECRSGKVTIRTTDEAGAASELVALIRKNFRQVASNWYFDAERGDFEPLHPDFQSVQKAGEQYVLYADVSEHGEVDQAVALVDQFVSELKLRNMPRHVLRDQLREMDKADAYLIASNDHPLWAIAIAELAHRNQWMLTGSRPDMPTRPPSVDSIGWALWLDTFFAQETSRDVLAQLGYTGAELINKAAQAAVGNGDVTSTYAADFF